MVGILGLTRHDSRNSPHKAKARPTHFPVTPFLNQPPLPQLPKQHIPHNHSYRRATMDKETETSAWRTNPSSPKEDVQDTSIYDAFARSPASPTSVDQSPGRESVIEINATSRPQNRVLPLLSPVPVIRERVSSRASSIANFSNPPSIYSPSSTVTDLTDNEITPGRHSIRSPSDGGYDSSSTVGRGGRRNMSNVRAHMENAEVLEEHADEDRVSARISVSSKHKADKLLGLSTSNSCLASAYICSGLGLVPEAWTYADSDSIRGVRPAPDSLGTFWRPEVLSNAYTGDRAGDLFRVGHNTKGMPVIKEVLPGLTKPDGRVIADAGAQAARLLVAKTIKAAHPKDVEVINAPTAPADTCHTFTFTLPRHDTLTAIARTRLGAKLPAGATPAQVAFNAGYLESQVRLETVGYHGNAKQGDNMDSAAAARAVRESSEIQYYGVTILTWYHADEKRHEALKQIRANVSDDRSMKAQSMRSQRSYDQGVGLLGKDVYEKPKYRRLKLPWVTTKTDITGLESPSEADLLTDRELDSMSPLVRLGIKIRKGPPKIKQYVQLQQEDYEPKVLEGGNVFWIPVAHTLVSRHPIYDALMDFLRVDIAKFAKNSYWHNINVLRILNYNVPRPGDMYQMKVGTKVKDEIIIKAYMPGAVDFEKGIVKVDYQLWPFFQAIDLDHILVCIEVAMSQTGRIIFTSRHTHMLSVVVSTLRYILDMRGWDGITIPMIHARDTSFIVEDPGPYIIGLPTELKGLIGIPSEVVMIDIDTNSLVCKKLPPVVTPKHRREKSKARIEAVLGPAYTQSDRGVPIDFKVTAPMGSFKHLNHFSFPQHHRPSYVDQGMQAPEWWKHNEIMVTFDKIMADKHKKPTLIQRLTRSGVSRAEAQLSVGEQVAKVMMRRRALHYVEARDQLEIKIARVNHRLAAISHDGKFWRSQLHKFESYASQLATHSEFLRKKVDLEKEAMEQLQTTSLRDAETRQELEIKLKATEEARAEAMRQLSDMHQSIQELEREREQIMDVFEDQLNVVLDSVPDSSHTRSPTPCESMLDSPQVPRSPTRSRTAPRSRPTTRDSEMSSLSRMTTGTQQMSIMGAMRQGAGRYRSGASSFMSGDLEGRAYERSDYVSQRIAAIQSKLEAALHNSTSMRSVSVPTELETVDDDEDDEQDSKHTDETPKRQIMARPHTAAGNAVEVPFGSLGKQRPVSTQITSSEMSAIGDTTFGQDNTREGALARLTGQDDSGKVTERSASPTSTRSRRVSLMKPGVSYRVRPKRMSTTSVGRVSVASGRSDGTSVFDPPSLVQHDRFVSSSTEGDIITPLPSMDRIDKVAGGQEILDFDNSLEEDDCVKDGEQTNVGQGMDKRSSTISTTTMTFGQ